MNLGEKVIRRGEEMELWKEFQINLPGKAINQIIRIFRIDQTALPFPEKLTDGKNRWSVLFRFQSNLKAEKYRVLADWNVDYGTSRCMPKLEEINKRRKEFLNLIIDEHRSHWV